MGKARGWRGIAVVVAAAFLASCSASARKPDGFELRTVAKSSTCTAQRTMSDPHSPGRCIDLGRTLLGGDAVRGARADSTFSPWSVMVELHGRHTLRRALDEAGPGTEVVAVAAGHAFHVAPGPKPDELIVDIQDSALALATVAAIFAAAR